MVMWRLRPQIKRVSKRWAPLNYPRILEVFTRKPLQIHSLVVALMFMVAMMLWAQRKQATATLAPLDSCAAAAGAPVAAESLVLFDSMAELPSYEQAFMSGVLIWLRQQQLIMAPPAERADHGRSYYLGFKRRRRAGAAQVVPHLLSDDRDSLSQHTAEYCVYADVLVRAYHRDELSYLGLTQLDHLDYFRPPQAVYLVDAEQVHLYEACALHRIRYGAQ